MARFTPSIAKNVLRRALWAVADPMPTANEVEALWEHFGHACAYCGKDISRGSRTGHLDHVVPLSAGGTNSIRNHVLACAACNGDLKREAEWLPFLQRMAPDPADFDARRTRITSWLSPATPAPPLTPEDRQAVAAIVDAAFAAVDRAVADIRAIRKVSDRAPR